jgi:3-hydroxyacyl-[acyl-carrier-protein] dehydratase|tara:strand:+ start:414 stop:845 length:432 start_codon:yes stop_codon:yes gene_type:complete
MNIQNYLPHRYPFLLIDKVIDIEKNKSITAQKNVSYNEPFFQGHFPDYPVFPGVLLLESMAQATAILDIESNNRDMTKQLYYFVGIDKARFKKQVFPGDVIIINAKLNQSKSDIHKFSGECRVNDEVVCMAELIGAVRSKNDR